MSQGSDVKKTQNSLGKDLNHAERTVIYTWLIH